jgi:hypothetical protein
MCEMQGSQMLFRNMQLQYLVAGTGQRLDLFRASGRYMTHSYNLPLRIMPDKSLDIRHNLSLKSLPEADEPDTDKGLRTHRLVVHPQSTRE